MSAVVYDFGTEFRRRRPKWRSDRVVQLAAFMRDEAPIRELYRKMVLVDFVGCVARACAS